MLARAREHVFPEDWPGILQGFQEALKQGGVLYFTVELPDAEELASDYERAKARWLPVVPGELANEVDAACERVKALGQQVKSWELADVAVYHYYPSLEQVRVWLGQVGLALEEEGTGDEYQHFLARKKSG